MYISPGVWPTPVVPEVGMLKQEDCHEFKASLRDCSLDPRKGIKMADSSSASHRSLASAGVLSFKFVR